MRILDLINPYAIAMNLRRAMYRRGILHSSYPGLPVISIGNLTMGGTGKSPMTILIGKYIESTHKRRVAVVSRGYGRESKGYLLVRDGTQILAKVNQSGDEAQMIATALPDAIVMVDEDRAHGARQAALLGAQCVLLDDGFQHLALKRDLDILLFDAQTHISPVLPFGRSRERLSASADANLIVFTNSTADDFHEDILSEMADLWQNPPPTIRCRTLGSSLSRSDGSSLPLTAILGKRVLAVSSIASPERFHSALQSAGVAEVVPFVLRDHAGYRSAIIANILAVAHEKQLDAIVTTEKDIVKSRHFFERDDQTIPVYVLSIVTEFLSGKDRFYERLDQLF